MEELYQTKTTHREIWQDWKAELFEFVHTWEYWWLLTLACCLTAAIFAYLPKQPAMPAVGVYGLLGVFCAYMTNRQWSVHNV